MVKRLANDLCLRLNDSAMNSTSYMNNGGILIQLLDKNLLPIVQTLLQYCSGFVIPSPYNSSDLYGHENVWLDNINAFPKISNPICGLVAGEDARLLFIQHELWLMTHCYFGTCDPRAMFRIKLNFDIRSEENIIAYVVPNSKTPLPGGRNFVFFHHDGEEYMLHTLNVLSVFRVSDNSNAVTKPPLDLSKHWHLHGGMMVYWNTTRNRGYLGVAHMHLNYGKFGLWGYNYVSSMILLSDSQPFELIRMGKRFCFASLEYVDKCDVVQFISSITISDGHLLIGYGLNDCETRLWSLSIDEVDDLIGEPINTPVEGRVYKGNSRTIYLYSNAKFHAFQDFQTFVSMGFDIDDIITFDASVIENSLGSDVGTSFIENRTYKGSSRSIYLYKNGSFHEFQDFQTFAAMGFDTSETIKVADSTINEHLGDALPLAG